MNRKNLTAAVLAGLAGVAGLAGTAGAAVNLNPDGLGDVLIYPYYNTRDGNQTLMTVVNTTQMVKAVKVRFLESYNSREVLDFNLYLSPYDVWVASIHDRDGVPHLLIPDNSCTVPYLYGYGIEAGMTYGLQEFLPYAYSGDENDTGPEDLSRAAEGYMEIIEMGVLNDDSYQAASKAAGTPEYLGSASAAVHVLDDDGNEVPQDCWQLERRWGEYIPPTPTNSEKVHPKDGAWFDEIEGADDETVVSDMYTYGSVESYVLGGVEYEDVLIARGGLFGSAAVLNAGNGTMFSYDAKALQGFDTTADGIHYKPGTINPSLDDGNETQAVVFLGGGDYVPLDYAESVEAVSAVFMHDTIANTYVISQSIGAATEWVITFPTKSWYVDPLNTGNVYTYFQPDVTLDGCSYLGWNSKKPNPYQSEANGGTYDQVCAEGQNAVAGGTGAGYDDWAPSCTDPVGYEDCVPESQSDVYASPPFTEAFDDGESCDPVSIEAWNRNESPTKSDEGYIPPIVSPAPPPTPGERETPFELCYEVNVVRFGADADPIFGGVDYNDGGTVHVYEVDDETGWAVINFNGEDRQGLQGLPVVGFAAEEYQNNNLANPGVQAYYGGLFDHKGSVSWDD